MIVRRDAAARARRRRSAH